ncbi:unnamed protein product, partial [Tilletia controversa]
PLPEALSELTFYKDKLWFRDVGVKDNYYGSLCNHRVVRQPREQDSVIQLQDGDQLEFGEFDQPIGSRDHLDFIDMCACSFFTACTNRHQLDGRSRSCGADSGFNDTRCRLATTPSSRARGAPRADIRGAFAFSDRSTCNRPFICAARRPKLPHYELGSGMLPGPICFYPARASSHPTSLSVWIYTPEPDVRRQSTCRRHLGTDFGTGACNPSQPCFQSSPGRNDVTVQSPSPQSGDFHLRRPHRSAFVLCASKCFSDCRVRHRRESHSVL